MSGFNVTVIRDSLGAYLGSEPPPEIWANVVQRIRQYLALDNKRKNLVGEGFEDVLAQVLQRTCRRDDIQVRTRQPLSDIRGFHTQLAGAKPNKVDISVVRPSSRTLVTAKWSVRADREKQFVTDFAEYVTARSDHQPFEYVFVTNEFDPARLMRACELPSGHSYMFTHVVHISTDAIKATYGLSGDERGEAASMQRVLKHIDDGRLISLSQWISKLSLT